MEGISRIKLSRKSFQRARLLSLRDLERSRPTRWAAPCFKNPAQGLPVLRAPRELRDVAGHRQLCTYPCRHFGRLQGKAPAEQWLRAGSSSACKAARS